MEVVIVADGAEVGTIVADAVEALLDRTPGRGARPGHRQLAGPGLRRAGRPLRSRPDRFGRARAFLLDEYVGLPPGHPESYRSVIERAFTGRVDFPAGAVHGPGRQRGRPRRSLLAPTRSAIAAAGGVDLQLLGVGTDGHIGFNEPGSSLGSRTRLKTLTAADQGGQRPLLRLRRRRAPPRADAGRRDDPRGPPSRARGVGSGQGRPGRQGRRGTGDGDGPRLGAPAPPARHRGRGRRGRLRAHAVRLLPGDLGREARVATIVTPGRQTNPQRRSRSSRCQGSRRPDLAGSNRQPACAQSGVIRRSVMRLFCGMSTAGATAGRPAAVKSEDGTWRPRRWM